MPAAGGQTTARKRMRRLQRGRFELGPPSAATVGAAAFPVVGAGGRFVTVQVELCEGEDALPDGLSPDSRRAVVEALEAARREVGSDHPLAVRFDRLDWTDTSCGLAVAIAATSALRRSPQPHVPLATGEVRADGSVDPVSRITPKLALMREHRPLGNLLVPRGSSVDDLGLTPVSTLAAALGPHPDAAADDLDDVLRDLLKALDAGRWQVVSDLARRVLAHRDALTDERGEALAALLTVSNHTGDHARARAIAEEHPWKEVRGQVLAKAVGAAIVAALDELDLARARGLLAAVDRGAIAEPDLVHLDGPAAMLAVFEGRFVEALALREANVDRAEGAELPRCLGDLADVLLRLGEVDEALDAVAEARRERAQARRRASYLHRTDAFLMLHQARALRAAGRRAEAHAVAAAIPTLAGPDPALRVGLLRAELVGDLGMAALAWDKFSYVHGSPLFRALLARTVARLGGPVGEPPLGLRIFEGLSVEQAGLRLPY